jgi:NADH:ubiquinone oxidoreductase subunit K
MDDITGTLFTVLLLPIAGSESAIGLILLLIYHPSKGTIII